MATTPEQMAVRASIIGSISVVLGLVSAFYFDVPVGPSIVVVATLIFLVFYFYPGVLKPK